MLVAVIGAAVWVGVRGWLAKGELEAAASTAGVLQKHIEAGDTADAGHAADSLVDHTGEAASLTGDPVWRLAELVPGVGANLHAVRVLSAELDTAASDAIRPLTGLTDSIGAASFRPVDGHVDVQPLIDAQPTVLSALGALTEASAGVSAIKDDGLLGPIAAARDDVAATLAKAVGVADVLENALRVAPTMLGADGPRNYLILFQNNAELRSAGGIPGALALLHTDGGTMRLTAQVAASDFATPRQSGLPVDETTRAIYGSLPGQFMQNVTMTPDFAVSASLAKAMWERRFGGVVDGVIAVDPVAIGYFLKATGPVVLPDGSKLTSQNAAKSLLQDVYQRLEEPADQDAYFAEAASAAFDAVSGGNADPTKLVRALIRAGDESRVALWSADPTEQAIFASTTLGGLDAAQRSAGDQAYGVYFNDTTRAKMDAYLDVAIDTDVVPRSDERSVVTVTVTLRNSAPSDSATSLTAHVTGGGRVVPEGQIGTNVTVYSPSGAYDFGVQKDGTNVAYASHDDGDRLVKSLGVRLSPGESTTLKFGYISAKAGQDSPVIVHTPTMTPLEVGSL